MRGLLLVIAFALAPSSSMAAPTITIPTSVQVRGPELVLAGIARLEGFDAETRARLSQASLGPAPVVGTGRVLSRAFLVSTLEALDLPKGTRLRLPARVEVSRAEVRLDGKSLRRSVETEVRKHLPAGVHVAELRVPELRDALVPAGASVDITVVEPVDTSRPIIAVLVVRDGSEVVRTQRVSVTADVWVSGVALADPGVRGQVLSARDLVEVRRPKSQMPGEPLAESRIGVGATLRQPVGAGEPISLRQVELPSLIHRGDRITMVADFGGVRITALGEALSAGSLGEPLRARNLDSLRVVTGRVTAAQTIQMED